MGAEQKIGISLLVLLAVIVVVFFFNRGDREPIAMNQTGQDVAAVQDTDDATSNEGVPLAIADSDKDSARTGARESAIGLADDADIIITTTPSRFDNEHRMSVVDARSSAGNDTPTAEAVDMYDEDWDEGESVTSPQEPGTIAYSPDSPQNTGDTDYSIAAAAVQVAADDQPVDSSRPQAWTIDQARSSSPTTRPTILLDSDRNPSTTAAVTVSERSHTIASGDTLSSLADRYFGHEKYAYLIERANPQLKNPNRLTVGETLTIPPPPDQQRTAAAAIATPGLSTPADSTGKTYTVTSGDTLSGIASKHLGSSARWREIFELNRATLKDDPGNLSIGMELRLPPR